MKPLAEAQADVLRACPPLPVERTPLESALGLVLAEDVTAPHPVPPFANSAMDGYAVVARDTAHPPVRLAVLEDVPAGSVASTEVRPGSAIKIMTGAPLPAGADSVVKVEDTETDSTEVVVKVAVRAGEAVRPAGSDVQMGETILRTGTRLFPPHLAVLATIGVGDPLVARRSRVAVMSTGDELVPIEEPLTPGMIHDSNRPLLLSMLKELGADVLDFGIIPDDPDHLRDTLAKAASEADVILTSGGVSMGEHDVVKKLLLDLGDIEFWRVAMQPAKPFAFGRLDGTPFFSLPGNPVSVMVAFEQFARPAILSMMGARNVFRPRISGTLIQPVFTDPEKTVFLRVACAFRSGRWEASLSGGQGSHVLSALAAANGFAVVPVGVGEVAAGAVVEVEMFTWPETRTREEVLGG